MPFTRIELLALAVVEGSLQVLLGKRAEAPHQGRWALPGGVLRIDLDADLDAACGRVAVERLGLALPGATQLCAVGARQRDPRAPWALSVVYWSTLQTSQLPAAPGKRFEALKWVSASAVTAGMALAFDHGSLVGRGVDALRQEVDSLRFPRGLMPDHFTLAELQAASEAVLGRTLDKSSFRRRIDAAGCIKSIDGQMRTGAFRPAQLHVMAGSYE